MRRAWPRVVRVVCGLMLMVGACSSDQDRGEQPPGPPLPPPDGPAGADAGIMSVRVIALSTTSAILSWYTFEPSSTQADWGADGSYGTTSPLEPELGTQHFVPLTDLSPGTTYHFRVRSTDGQGTERVSGDRLFVTQSDGPAVGVDYYLDAAAVAGGDGSSWEAAWTSPAQIGWDTLGPGDCVNIRAGRYEEAVVVQASGSADSPIVLKPHGPVLLAGGVQLPEETAFVRVQGFEVTTSGLGSPTGIGFTVDGQHVEVLDNYVHHTAYLSGIMIGGRETLVQNNLVYFAEGIAIVVSGSDNVVDDNDVSHSVCFEVGDADASRFFGERNVMRNNFFHDILAEDTPGASPHCDCFQTYAVNPGEMAHDITIENNYCFNICGQMFMGEGLLASDTHRNITFRGNVFEQVGAIAFNGGGISNLVIDHNTFVDSGLGAINVQVDGGAVTNNLFFRNPYAYACAGCTSSDYNLVWPFDCHSELAESHGLYAVDPALLDPDEHDYRPAPSSPACASGEAGSHIGAYPCEAPTGCWDPDQDGYGYPSSAECASPEADCDNADALVFPGSPETCNGTDDDCNGLRDEDCAELEPVLQLSFEDDVTDSSPNALPAQWSEGTGSYAPGHQGQGISVAGADSPFVVVPDDPRLGGMGLFSASVWAKKNSAVGGTVFLKHVCYMLGVGADFVHAYVQTDQGQADLNVYSGAPIDDTEWHHYLITYDSRAGEATLLVDGVELSSAAVTGTIRYEPCDPRELNVGRDPWGDSFDGLIDELAIYDGLIGG